ncbi:hypothetical protein ACQP3J_33885, partial [Escherichia coli]
IAVLFIALVKVSQAATVQLLTKKNKRSPFLRFKPELAFIFYSDVFFISALACSCFHALKGNHWITFLEPF